MEIERKYLVNKDSINYIKNNSIDKYEIKQGYLHNSNIGQLRIRLQNDKCLLTVKSNNFDLARYEKEISVPYNIGVDFLSKCTNIIEKTRYMFPWKNRLFEIDIFHGKHEGLVLAELEIFDESDNVLNNLPDFITAEVTGNKHYYNSYLVNN